MKPDPTTEEGKEEVKRIFEKRKLEAEDVRKRSEQGIEEEPSGKLTNSSEIDIHRDR
ncbi:MAG: hypothetical protein L3J89_05320 [Gammaproteobacteria bacterium]|nr:hypothetical protein [Gammaproteobacteria bacterium]